MATITKAERRKYTRKAEPTFCAVRRGAGPFVVEVTGPLAERIRDLHAISQGSSLQEWCIGVLEAFVVDHRSNKFVADPTHFDNRNGDDVDQWNEWE